MSTLLSHDFGMRYERGTLAQAPQLDTWTNLAKLKRTSGVLLRPRSMTGIIATPLQ